MIFSDTFLTLVYLTYGPSVFFLTPPSAKAISIFSDKINEVYTSTFKVSLRGEGDKMLQTTQ